MQGKVDIGIGSLLGGKKDRLTMVALFVKELIREARKQSPATQVANTPVSLFLAHFWVK
jgi:hypothetical protein